MVLRTYSAAGFLSFFFFCLSLQTSGQLKLDTAKIKGRAITDTIDRIFYSTNDGLLPLAKSKQYIEIRLGRAFTPMGGTDVTVLSFDGKQWNATLTTVDPHFFDILKKERTTKQYQIFPLKPYEEIFSDLVNTGLFSIPSQSELKVGRYVDDGTLYTIAYKVGSKFRGIWFDNPDEYREMFPKIKTFKQYLDLLAIFSKQFYRN